MQADAERIPRSARCSRPARRVLILTLNFELAGAQRQAVELAAGLAGCGNDVRVGVLHPGGPLGAELEELGIPIAEFRRRWRWDLSPIPRLVNYLRRERIEVIHSLLFLPNFYARCAGQVARTPAIVSSLRSTFIEGWPRYALDIATCALCHANIANSEAGRVHYVRRGGPRRRMVVIRNGLREIQTQSDPCATNQLRNRLSLTRFSHVLGMVASIEPIKNHSMLLRALADVVKLRPGVGLVLVGDGSRRRAVEGEVAMLGLQPHVEFAGQLRDPHAAYPLFDIYASASFTEGISNSILEAMAHGLPVVANAVGGTPEIVIDRVTGYLVPPSDVPAMAKFIVRLVDQPAERLAMGAAGANRVRTEFSIQRLAEQTSALYERLLNPGS